jgi:hypothetical protein
MFCDFWGLSYEEMIEQEKIITALVIEIKDLKERVRKLEEKKEDE